MLYLSQQKGGQIKPQTTEAIPIAPSVRHNSLGVVDRLSILRHLISKTKQKYNDRYSKILNLAHMDVETLLDNNLSLSVKELCERGQFTLSSLIALGGSPESSQEAGVYLHILWRQSIPSCFWLYVGQAGVFCVRIGTHKNPWRRQRQRSLHYTIWHSESDMESVFVKLAVHDAFSSEEGQLLLNLQEMWMSLVFQTLRGFHLDEFLPPGSNKLWAGNHLNVSIPLWQSFTAIPNAETKGGSLAFKEYLCHKDPAVRHWAEDARDAFNDLRNSPDPLLRRYYLDLNQGGARKTARAAWEKKKYDELREYLSGKVAIVTESHDGELSEVSAGSFRFTISRKLGLNVDGGDKVLLKMHLAETSPHPRAYAHKARLDEPAMSIEGVHGDFFEWLTTSGNLNVQKMNSLVDVLEGLTLEESESLPRRWHVRRMIPGLVMPFADIFAGAVKKSREF
ncbi:hypothetical protein N7467_010843 [Penicillium canescens]|nr:hypothetical protein N7467_010843 [Penicillium canescens]